MESNVKDKVVFTSPKTEEDRAFIAGVCVRSLNSWKRHLLGPYPPEPTQSRA
jgi:hypothetical protein